MHATSSTNGATPWYTHRWPWLLMLGPATVLAGGAYVAWLAARHPDALVVDDYYKQGKAINQDLRRDRAATKLGLALRAEYDPRAGTLAGRLTGPAAPFTVYLAHPTLPQRDLRVFVRPAPDGSFSVALPVLERTHWQVAVEGALRDWRLAKGWDGVRALEIVADKP
ncbi:cytochrome oxidase assembly protein [Massilia phosphatilytica]|nr:cytochrome oxidase assembly protein [Massilia phosphatilytica]